MKTIYLALMLGVAGQATAAGVYIDEAQKKSDKARTELIREGIRACGKQKFKTVGDREACQDKYFEEATAKYPARGSDAYAQKHYAGLSKPAAEQKLIELKAIYDQTTALLEKHPGQVTRRAVEAEGWWIQKNVLGASRTQTTPWFIECSKQKWQATVDHCPLGSGGKQ
ncbi:hypothetical protein [Stutzerimonas kunmingensis]|uniref:hypothetical protein n=1 Tax=Stutzerimonas kunmingensis TaxID=1211807 RepID=UPI0028AC8586|nr:hypothetical protein [Stutzerimonas kunmingensis]